jgi:hypothetical protein
MSDREDNNFVRKILIDDAERELPEDVFSEILEVEGQRWGAALILSTACSKAVSKLVAAMWLRSRYQLKDVRYSRSAWG